MAHQDVNVMMFSGLDRVSFCPTKTNCKLSFVTGDGLDDFDDSHHGVILDSFE